MSNDNKLQRPNILMIMVDQLRYPRLGYGEAGLVDPIKAILSFVGAIDDNPYAKHFPGFCKLREHAVVLTDHSIAESACVPSRASNTITRSRSVWRWPPRPGLRSPRAASAPIPTQTP